MRDLICSVAILFLLLGCGKENGDADANGFFEATEILVSSPVSGEIVDLNLEEGCTLQAGQYIGLIDTLDLHLQKRALIYKEQALRVTKPNLETLLKSSAEEIRHLRQELKRVEALVNENASTSQQLDATTSQLKVAEAKFNALRSTQGASAKSIDFQLEAGLVNISQIENLILKSKITSPISGIVLQKYIEKHEFVVPSQPLFVIADLSKMYLKAYISGDQLKDIQLNQRVKVFADYGDTNRREYEGNVIWISNKSEFTPKNIQTKDERAHLVYAVKIAVINDGKIKIGQYGEIAF